MQDAARILGLDLPISICHSMVGVPRRECDVHDPGPFRRGLRPRDVPRPLRGQRAGADARARAGQAGSRRAARLPRRPRPAARRSPPRPTARRRSAISAAPACSTASGSSRRATTSSAPSPLPTSISKPRAGSASRRPIASPSRIPTSASSPPMPPARGGHGARHPAADRRGAGQVPARRCRPARNTAPDARSLARRPRPAFFAVRPSTRLCTRRFRTAPPCRCRSTSSTCWSAGESHCSISAVSHVGRVLRDPGPELLLRHPRRYRRSCRSCREGRRASSARRGSARPRPARRREQDDAQRPADRRRQAARWRISDPMQ